jgi:hypothetical protein
VRMDETQRGWAIASLAILAVASAVYILYAAQAPEGPRGGSAIGLVFGALGFGFMIFAALLGARKRVPVWRLGRAQAWMRGHLWLGLLSLPIILFHGGFRFGGALTRVLMWLLIVTVVSGVFGAALQNYIPRVMTADVPLETIYDEIGHVRALLREEADRTMETLCGSLGLHKGSQSEMQRAGGFTATRRTMAATVGATIGATGVTGRITGGGAVAPAAEILLLTDEQSAPLRRFYLAEMRPFIEHPGKGRHTLADANRAQPSFSALRTLLPVSAHATLDDLKDICDEARQLRKQERLHQWLHGWLLVHIPISLALILLGAVHAVMALKY